MSKSKRVIAKKKSASVEERRANLMAWIAETQAQIDYVAGQLGGNGQLAGVMSESGTAAVGKLLADASQALLDAQCRAVQLIIPSFLANTEGGA